MGALVFGAGNRPVSRAVVATVAALIIVAGVAGPSAAADEGYHAAYFSESSFLVLSAGQSGQFAVGFANSGTSAWVKGTTGSRASLHTAAPLDNTRDYQTGWAVNWVSPVIYALQSADLVLPGQIGFFVYNVQVPAGAPAGPHIFYGRPNIEGLGPLEDYGYYHIATVSGSSPTATSTLTMSPASASLTVGQSQQFTATLRNADGSIAPQVTGASWAVSPTTLGTVGAGGLFTAATPGTGTITVTAGGRSATASVTVAGSTSAATSSARSVLLSVSDLGTDYTQVEEKADTFEEQAALVVNPAPYSTGADLLRALGYVDSWSRGFRRSVASGTYVAVSQATHYRTVEGARRDYEGNLGIVADEKDPVFLPSAAGAGIGDGSLAFVRDRQVRATDGSSVRVTELWFVFRSGTTSHTLQTLAYFGQTDAARFTQLARVQAQRAAGGATTAPAPIPLPTPTATPAPLPTTAPAAGPATVTTGGFTFRTSGGTANVYVETSVSVADGNTVVASATADVARVQATFGRTFTTQPAIYVFATTSSYTTGLTSVLRLPADVAARTGRLSNGLYGNGRRAIAINWQKAGATKPLTTIRHELVHAMIGQLAPSQAYVPMWLNEGLATLEEETVSGSEWLAAEHRYTTASMAATDTLFTLAELTSYEAWNGHPDSAIPYQYHASSQTARFMREDLGTAVTRIIELIGQGQSFEAAYQSVAGRPFSTFSSAYPTRSRALAPTYPGVVTTPNTRYGPGLGIYAFGFTPGTRVAFAVTGPRASATGAATANAYGVGDNFLDSTFVAGTYTVTATGANGTASTTGVKSASTVVLAAPTRGFWFAGSTDVRARWRSALN